MTDRGIQMKLDVQIDSPLIETAAAENGEVFTRSWVVDLVLDLAGYRANNDLASQLAVEPACGAGAFLGPMVDRLVESCAIHGKVVGDAEGAIRAFDLLDSNVAAARNTVTERLVRHRTDRHDARRLAEIWIRQADFLLSPPEEQSAHYVLGNPPYIRLENLPQARNAAYRAACPTMRGRSDIFVGFIEMGLRLLAPEGALGFIVADRWMRNQYGALLRTLIAEHFAVEAVVEMHDVDAFEHDVSAYPAVTVIRRAEQTDVIVASASDTFDGHGADVLRSWHGNHESTALATPEISADRLPGWFSGDQSWPTGSPAQLAVIADLELRFPPLEDPRTGTRVGIGVATGADDVYLTTDPTVVEPERLLPLVMARDLDTGQIQWSGTYLVNPWDENGLVNLSDWPDLNTYLESNAIRVRSRHTARKSPEKWHRTIDRVASDLLGRPKLLIPEMKAAAHPVLDTGAFYPHHNLYHVTSTRWDLEVLGGLLLSDVANLFVGTYCVKMRGGWYRFQAQYLRRIRVPELQGLSASIQRRLRKAFNERDVAAATGAALSAYEIQQWPER